MPRAPAAPAVQGPTPPGACALEAQLDSVSQQVSGLALDVAELRKHVALEQQRLRSLGPPKVDVHGAPGSPARSEPAPVAESAEEACAIAEAAEVDIIMNAATGRAHTSR